MGMEGKVTNGRVKFSFLDFFSSPFWLFSPVLSLKIFKDPTSHTKTCSVFKKNLPVKCF